MKRKFSLLDLGIIIWLLCCTLNEISLTFQIKYKTTIGQETSKLINEVYFLYLNTKELK